MSTIPVTIIHADWSLDPSKRWWVRAEFRPDGVYEIQAPQLVPPLTTLLEILKREKKPVVGGLDFPIGLPLAYAQKRGCEDFVSWLRQLRSDDPFYSVVQESYEISLERPFYPHKPGGRRQQQLLDGLEVDTINQLRRQCDLATDNRAAAAPLFWTLGAQQVGKAAIVGWRDLIAPALQDEHLNAAVWPFEGNLATLLQTKHLIFAEAYPAEFYHHLGVRFQRQTGRPWGKRVQAERQKQADCLLTWANRQPIVLHGEMRELIMDGFGAAANGEDKFDATIGLLGMLNVILGNRLPGEPTNEQIRHIEGWILGMKRG